MTWRAALLGFAGAMVAGTALAEFRIAENIAPVRPTYYLFGYLGGGAIGGRNLNQTAGSFSGRIDSDSAFVGGGAAEATLYRFGDMSRSFGGFDLQARLNIDVYAARAVPVQELPGGVNSGSIDNTQINVLAGPQLRTPIWTSERSWFDLYGFALAGAAVVRTHGEALSGVRLTGTDSTWAVRVGGGAEVGLGGPMRAGLEYGYQITGSTQFRTNFVDEIFRQDSYGSHRIVFRIGVALNGVGRPFAPVVPPLSPVRQAGQGPAPGPRGPAIAQDQAQGGAAPTSVPPGERRVYHVDFGQRAAEADRSRRVSYSTMDIQQACERGDLIVVTDWVGAGTNEEDRRRRGRDLAASFWADDVNPAICPGLRPEDVKIVDIDGQEIPQIVRDVREVGPIAVLRSSGARLRDTRTVRANPNPKVTIQLIGR